MAALQVRQTVCQDCPCYLQYDKPEPVKQKGVVMQKGERYCLAGRRPRLFGRKDPKIKVPSWCPRRKSPCELRIYRFKDQNAWYLHKTLCDSLEQEISPDGRRYALEFELTTLITAKEFAMRCKKDSDAVLLGVTVHLHHVVEIDDGIRSVFFYKTTTGYRYERSFDAEIAKANPLEYVEVQD